jgi:hypothetical protein
MAGQAQRLADLERQVGELRIELKVTRAGLEHVFAAGRESVTNPRPAAPVRYLHAVPDLEPEPELEVSA